MLADHIAAAASAVMGLSAEKRLDPEAGFFQLGMDSLMSVTLQRQPSGSLGVPLPAALIYEYPTISALTEALCERMGLATDESGQAPARSGLAAWRRNAPWPARRRGEQKERACGVTTLTTCPQRDRGHRNGRPVPRRRFGDGVLGEPAPREESIQTLSEEDLTAAGVAPGLADPAYVRRAALLSGIEEFDADYFEMTPYTARMMDPQQRLFLQTAWHALEDSGYDPAAYDGSIGVFASSTASGYLMDNLMSHRDPRTLVGEGVTVEMFNLVLLNDKGLPGHAGVPRTQPARAEPFSVQTACSSSLVAVHLACQSLLSGECDMALTGASAVRVPHRVGYTYEPGAMVSPSGHCRPFDANSDGTIFGSGVAALILAVAGSPRRRRPHPRRHPRLGDQQRRRAEDHLCRPCRGRPGGGGRRSAGRRRGRLVHHLHRDARHRYAVGRSDRGRGPAPGVRTLRCRPFRPMRVGFGEVEHRTPRCGVRVAGLVKTILCLKNKAIPPTVHYTAPNPELHLDTTPFRDRRLVPAMGVRRAAPGGVARSVSVAPMRMSSSRRHPSRPRSHRFRTLRRCCCSPALRSRCGTPNRPCRRAEP